MSIDYSAAVANFLQTAIVLDDEAYEPLEFEHSHEGPASLGDESIDDSFLPSVEDVLAVPTQGEGGGVLDESGEEALDRPRALFTEALVEGFADYGIACTVLKPVVPGRQEQDHSRLRALARRADIIILDWQLTGVSTTMTAGLQGSDGTSLSFLKELLKEDQKYGPRFRLVCIYTGNPAVAEIASRLEDAVSEILGKSVSADSNLSISHGPLKIVLVSKKRRDVPEITSSVTAAELPGLMVSEFGKLVSTGLLPDLALSALSSIRDGAHHLLHRFDSDLDPALISHFARAGGYATADFVRTLITDEFSSILSVPGSVDYLAAGPMSERISLRLQENGPDYYLAVSKDPAKSVTLELNDVISVLDGSVGTGEFRIARTGKKVNPPSLTTVFMHGGSWDEISKNARLVDQRLSVLSCMARTPSSTGLDYPPILQSGSVIVSRVPEKNRHEQDQDQVGHEPILRYWLCLQPLCDSTRLEELTSFPFVPLKANHSQYTDIIVEHEGAMLPLTTHGTKFNQIFMPQFAPNPNRSAVEAESLGAGVWTFNDSNGTVYTWLGQVRQWKVQKMVSAIASNLDRIGLDEYEYLRKLSSAREV